MGEPTLGIHLILCLFHAVHHTLKHSEGSKHQFPEQNEPMLLYIGCSVASLLSHKSEHCKSLLLSCRYNHKLMELVHVVLKEVGDFAVREDRFLVSSPQQCTASAAHRYWKTSNHVMAALYGGPHLAQKL